MSETNIITVTIRCATYNHEPYIRQCLEGFVMQQTNFKFEVIVHDDASTDGTADIIREFANKYPGIIKPFYQKENQYSKDKRVIAKLFDDNTHGKYIAICEGDDYWIDPLKLQRQVDFLESNLEYTLCFHNVNVICEGQISDNLYTSLEDKDYTGDEVLREWTIPTCSVLLRTATFNQKPFHENFMVGDNVLWATCAQFGKLRCINTKMAVYRRLASGATFSFTAKKQLLHYVAMSSVFPVFNDTIKTLIKNVGCVAILQDLKQLKFRSAIHNIFLVSNETGVSNLIAAFIHNVCKRLKKQ